MYKPLFILLLSSLLINCSQMNRTSVLSVDNETLNVLLSQMIEDVQPFSTEASALVDLEGSVIYFGEGSINPEAPVSQSPEALFAFTNMDFFEPELLTRDLFEARVVLLFNELTGEHSLIIDAVLTVEAESIFGKQMITKYYRQAEGLHVETDKWTQNKKFEMVLEDTITGEYIYLKTFDVNSNEELKPAIQLEVWTEVNGQLLYNGKFSALNGFE